MNALAAVAAFVQSSELEDMPAARFEQIKRHVVDAWGAAAAGSRVEESVAIDRLVRISDCSLSRIVAGSARTRCTEIDDIHLTSCTTPGSVVVPTASALAAAAAPIRMRHFCAAVLAGYECLVRAGFAADGPARLHAGLWPTAFGAAFGAAAAASRLLRLGIDDTAGALATSLAFAQERAVASAPAGTSRWLSLGVAAASGTAAAFAARNGLVGRIDTGRLSARLTRGIGRHYLFDTTGMKPYPTARQGLAAIEGVRDLVRAHEIDASGIDRIVIGLPKLQQAIVDRRGFPSSRFESIVGLRYQIALALVAPERLLDVRRTPPFDTGALRRLMGRIRIERARELERHYPRRWPARVEICARRARQRLVVLHPRGDARNPLGWQDLALKLRTIAGPAVGEATVERVVNEWREAGRDGPVPELP